MNDEGQFRFTNGIVIDTDLKFDRVNSVVNHEFIHSQLYSMTTYGQIVLMLEKNSLFHNKSKEFQEVLFGYIKRMQERTAVNVEIMLECIENGLDAYNDAIAKLQQKNRSYYNYFRKLCCINGKINSEDSAEELADILMRIAVFALNVNPELIPLDELDDAKSLKVYFDNPKNNALISPNRRFDILVNTIFRKNDNNSDIESVIKGSINLEEMENYDYIHNLAFQKVSKILIKSPIASRLIARIATVGTESFAIKKGMDYLNVKPAKINTIKEVFNIPVECKEEFIKLLNKQKHKELFVMHSLGGFEDWHVICIYERKGDKNISYSIFVDDNDFFRLISNTLCNFVFYKTKLMKNEGKSIRKMVKKLPIYVFEDTPILTTMPFIEKFFICGKFGFIKYDKHYILVVNKRNIIFFANILKEAKDVLIREFCENNLYYIENTEEICDITEVVRLAKTCNEYEVNNIENFKSER